MFEPACASLLPTPCEYSASKVMPKKWVRPAAVFWARVRAAHRYIICAALLLLWTILTISGFSMLLLHMRPPSISAPHPVPSILGHLGPARELSAHAPAQREGIDSLSLALIAPVSTEVMDTLSPATFRSLQRMLRLSPRRLNDVQRVALAIDLQAALDRLDRLGGRSHSEQPT